MCTGTDPWLGIQGQVHFYQLPELITRISATTVAVTSRRVCMTTMVCTRAGDLTFVCGNEQRHLMLMADRTAQYSPVQ
jgi:hypothetical protein